MSSDLVVVESKKEMVIRVLGRRIAGDMTLEQALEGENLSRSSYYAYIARFPELLEAVREMDTARTRVDFAALTDAKHRLIERLVERVDVVQDLQQLQTLLNTINRELQDAQIKLNLHTGEDPAALYAEKMRTQGKRVTLEETQTRKVTVTD